MSKVKVARVDDASYGSVKRYVYRVVMPGNPPVGHVETALRWLILKARLKGKFNALGFFVYRSESEIDGIYTVAKGDYAPNGDWADAATVHTGDYSKMKLVFEMKD